MVAAEQPKKEKVPGPDTSSQDHLLFLMERPLVAEKNVLFVGEIR